VVHPDGILLEDSGITVPQGTLLSVPLEPVHYDESFYPEANRYNPYRFADPERLRSLVDAFNPNEKGESCNTYSYQEKSVGPESTGKQKQSASLDDAFLGFGYGKHACPGRFFALNEVKIFVAHMLMNYEVEYMKDRPRPTDTVWLKLPLHGGKIRVRPRKA
jgi:cytochrome P450